MAGERGPMVITHEGGVQFAVQIGTHRLVVDQPAHAGGADAGPSPIQLLGASLGSCVALYVKQFCDARGLPYEGMRVEVATHGARDPNRIARFEVRVMLPQELPARFAEMLERVARSCPAHNTLADGASVVIAIEQGAAAVTTAP